MPKPPKTIVALHGAGMSAPVWEGLQAALPGQWQALTLPGHGKDGEPPLPSIEKMAAWVKTQLQGRTSRSVVLLGHSMGALVALETASDPAVAALILLGAAATMPVHPDLLQQAAENPEAAADIVLKWGVFALHPQVNTLRAKLKQQMQAVPPATLHNDLAACNNYTQGAATAATIVQPTLIISGADDKMTKASAGKALADLMRPAEFHTLPGCGHMLMAEQPAATAAVISRFLRD